jgi:hypothetical protein
MIGGGACSNAADPQADAGRADARLEFDAESLGVDAGLDANQTVPLRINEVAAQGDPADWVELFNVGAQAIELSEFALAEVNNDPSLASPLPLGPLAPGGYVVIEVSDATLGFKLGSDEEVWLYQLSDGALIDGTDWADGDSPAGGSWARMPDGTGAFSTATVATRGQPN